MTSTALLGEDSLHDLLERLWCIRDTWRNLGLALGHDSASLNSIEMDYSGHPHKTNECFRALLEEWLRGKKSCWKMLAKALCSLLVGAIVKEGKCVIILCRIYLT